MELKWEEPIADGRGRWGTKWALVADELKKRPGSWAVVAEDMSPTIAQYLKKYGLEVTCRGIRNNRAEKVYARFPEVPE